jgi:hypothetical protein
VRDPDPSGAVVGVGPLRPPGQRCRQRGEARDTNQDSTLVGCPPTLHKIERARRKHSAEWDLHEERMQRMADGPAAQGVAERAFAKEGVQGRRQLLCEATKGRVLLEVLKEHGGGRPIPAMWCHGSSSMILAFRYPRPVPAKRQQYGLPLVERGAVRPRPPG